MPLSFWEYARLGADQWRGQQELTKRLAWYVLGTPDVHTRVRNAHVCNLIERLELPPNARVLDAGSGRGVSLFYLAAKHPTWQLKGLELDEGMVVPSQRAAAAGRCKNLGFVKTSVSDLAEENAYDLAICMEILEHVQDDVGLLRRIHRALRPGGRLIVTAPRRRQQQWRWLRAFSRHDVKGEFGHVRDEYLEGELESCLRSAGFAICEFHQTFGRQAEIAFELNNLFWENPPLRRAAAILTYPLAMPLAYKDTLRYQAWGNTFLALAERR